MISKDISIVYTTSLKVGIRRLIRERFYASIAILSLAVGIASFVILGIYALYELSYDRHHQDADRIYRVIQTEQRGMSHYLNRIPLTGTTFASLMARTDSSFSDYLRIQTAPMNPYLLESEDNALYWENVVIADENIFEFFDHEILSGDPQTALVEPNTIAISSSMAIAYFGGESPIGRRLVTNLGTGLTVSLVYKDLPKNSHLNYSAIISQRSLNTLDVDSMESRMLTLLTLGRTSSTYFKMAERYSPDRFQASVDTMAQTYLPAIASQEGLANEYGWYLEPLTDIHLNSLADGSHAQSSRYLVLTYLVIGGFVLLVANLNFTSISISRYSKRTKELGLRKVVGAGRGQLIRYFFVENALVLFFSICLATALVPIIQASIPLGGFLDGSVSLAGLLDTKIAMSLSLVVVVVGMLSALYPAIFLTGIRLIDIVKGQLRAAKSSFWTKEAIVFLQFAVSAGGIACAVLMINQMQHIQQLPLGFEIENNLAIQIRGKENVERIPLLENQLRAHTSIRSTAITNRLPFTLDSIATGSVETNTGERQTLPYHRIYGGSDYVATFGLEILQGRDLSALPNIQSTNAVIVNEAFVETMNWDNPIGKILFTPGAYGLSEVVGVARNFNYLGFETSHEPIAINTLDQQAVVMRESGRSIPTYYRYLIVSMEEGWTNDVMKFIEDVYSSFDTDSPLLYEFIEERYDDLRTQQLNQALLMSVFSLVTVVITCSGMVGLIAFKLAENVKQIGIRKVLGASRRDIIGLQLKSVLVNVLIAAIVGCTTAAAVFGYWQAQFSADYRISQQFVAFAIAVGVVAGSAALTTAAQTFMATKANPVQSLRYE